MPEVLGIKQYPNVLFVFLVMTHEHDAPYVDVVYYIICILSANFQNTRSESDNIGRYNITPVNN
jgi:hypothetical protein